MPHKLYKKISKQSTNDIQNDKNKASNRNSIKTEMTWYQVWCKWETVALLLLTKY